MFYNEPSPFSKATFKEWNFNETSRRTSETSSLLQTILRNQRQHIKLDCSGCQTNDSSCNCSLNEIAIENTFQVYVILESRLNFGTQWCPPETVRSDFFKCDEEGKEVISAKLTCNGWVDCPLSKADESHFVCSPLQVKLFGFVSNLTLYLVALGSATFLICSRRKEAIRPLLTAVLRVILLTEREKTIISKTLQLLSKYMKDQSSENMNNVSKSIQRMTKSTKLKLIKVAHSIEVKVSDTVENIFEPTIEQVFRDESQRKELFVLIKQTSILSTKIKLDVLEALEPKGRVKLKIQDLMKKISPAVKISLIMLKGTLAASVGLLLIPLPEMKDLITIISLKVFHQDVIQGRTDLIDNVPLEDFVVILSIIYGVTFILRIISARSSSISSTTWHHLIPFVPDIEIALRTIQEVIKRHKINLMIQYTLDNLKDNEEDNSEWLKVVTLAEKVEESNLNLEVLGDRRRQIKLISCFGDILQGCVLMVLLLRTDLRIQSLLQFSSMCRKIGIDPRNGGASGKSSNFCLDHSEFSLFLSRCHCLVPPTQLEPGIAII